MKKLLRKICLLPFFVWIIIFAFKDKSRGKVSPIGEAVAIFPPIVPTFLIWTEPYLLNILLKSG